MSHLVLALLGLVPFGLVRSFDLQGVARIAADPASVVEVPSPVPVVFEGLVFDSQGAPAAGALVVSSAGGRAVTARNGRYRIEVEVPVHARSVWITAVGAGSGKVASTAVELSAESEVVWVQLLELARGSTCQPSWLPTFGSLPGTYVGAINALAVFDDGSGPALYAGGLFQNIGGVAASHIAKWDGRGWMALGSGLENSVWSLVVFDDGNGPALYAGGIFTAAGGVPANRVAKWDGSSWSALGSGMTGGPFVPATNVRALAVFDDGSGQALYAAGNFTTAGGVAASRIAKWNGLSWTALGSGLSSSAFALTVFDDGSGPALYVGGGFSTAGGVTANGIAKWDGSAWSPVGGGIAGNVAVLEILALTVFDDGNGPALCAGGQFTTAGGVPANNIAKWDGSNWEALSSGVDDEVRALTVFDDGGGPALYAGGDFTAAGGGAASLIAKWDGSSWSALGSGISGSWVVQVLTAFDDGSGPALFTGGDFFGAGGLTAYDIAAWNGSVWRALGSLGMGGSVSALTVFDDGRGPALYAGGTFLEAGGGVAASRIARWDGSNWEALSSGVNDEVRALTVFDDGSGPALYAAGVFTTAGGGTANLVARWDGSSWSALDNGLFGLALSVHALTVFDDGRGPALYAGGEFRTSTGRNVAKWDGTTWVAVGGGTSGVVHALELFDDGNGPALYAGGALISAGGLAASRIARWDGTTWTALGSGLSSRVRALTAFDDGNGSALFVGGDFTTAGGIGANNIAKWDGAFWSAVGGGMGGAGNRVLALTVFDGGCGKPVLCAGGRFTTAGAVAANNIAQWNGSSWEPLGGGVAGAGVMLVTEIRALTIFNDRTGPALHAGGEFLTSDSGDWYLAKWGSPDTTAPVITCPDPIVIDDRPVTGPGETVTYSVVAKDEQDPTPTLVCDPPSGSHFPRGTTLVTCTVTDFTGNQTSCEFTVTVGAKPPKHFPGPSPR